MTAREKFRIGDRIRTTAYAERRGVAKQVETGVVVGFGHSPKSVTVLRDGRKTRYAYHMDFWEPVAADPQETP